MNFEYNSDTGITEVAVGLDDICLFCNLLEYCPLIGALETNLVYPSADKITIQECSIYEQINEDN